MASYDQLDYAALFRSVNRDKPAEDPAKSRGFMRGAADLGLEAASGVTRGVGMLANVFGANNAVSQGARSADEFIREYLSAQSKEDSARASAILAEAEDAGIGDQVAAGLRAFAQNPVSTTVNALGQAVPVIAGALIPGMGPATVAGRVGMAGIGAAQGAGAVKGSIFDAVKAEQMRQPGMTEADATAAAEEAQSYTGQNTGNILGGAALGGVAGSTGFQPAAARILTRSGMLSQSTQQIEQGLLRKIGADKLADAAETRAGGALTGALVEGGTEFAQGGQEQYAANVALQREGFDVPTFRGVVSQGVMEAAAGGALGAGFGALEKPRSTRTPTIHDIAEAPTVDEAIKAFTNVLALPAPATKASWEVVDGQQLLQGPATQPSQPATGMLGLPAPTGRPVLMADQFGNVTTQPATQRAEAVSRANMAMAEAEQATAAQRQRAQELGKQTPRGESPPERIPVGEATRFDPIPAGDATDLIPTGEATDLEQLPTGSATELEVETIQADDFLTADNQPYGTKTGAAVRARREGLGPANVVAVPGGWVVRPQPTALSQAGQEVQPKNTRGTRAGDVLRAPNVNQSDMAVPARQPVGSGDGRGDTAVSGSAPVGLVPAAPERMVPPAAEPEASPGGNRPVADAGRPNAALIPAEGTPLTLDGKLYTVAAAGKRYVTIADASGKERVISDGSYLWPRVQKALKETAPNLSPETDAPAQQAPAKAKGTETPAPAATAGAAVATGADTAAVQATAPTEPVDWKARMAAAMKADGAVATAEDGSAAANAKTLRKQADALQDDARKMLEGIPAGQPVRSTRDANLREKAREKSRKAIELMRQADRLETEAVPEPAPKTLKERMKAPKVYKTRANAEAAKSGNTQRIRKTKDGFILRQATDKELAAAEKAGRRLAGAGVDVEKDSLLAAIAKLGGLAIRERADTVGTGNKNVGGKMVFRLGGQPLDELAAGALREYGYVPAGELERDGGTRWLRDAIRAEFNGLNQYWSEQGVEAIMERQRAQEEADFMASQEAEDVFGDLDADEVQASGYTAASPEIQAMTERLVAEAEALGVDVESIRERVSMASNGSTQDEYEFAVQQALIEAIERTRSDAARRDAGTAARSSEDRGQAADGQGQEEGLKRPPVAEGDRITFTGNDGTVIEGIAVQVLDTSGGNYRVKIRTDEPAPQGGGNISRTVYSHDGTFEPADGLTLEAQDAESLRAKTEREASATKAAASQKAAEQERLRREAEARDMRARADATVDDFQLGQDANAQMSGMGDLFADAKPASQAAAILDAAADPPKGRERLDVLKDVKAGAITPDEVQAAYPPKEGAADPLTLPIGVRTSIRWALGRLNDAMGALSGVERARGRGQTLALEWRDQQDKIKEGRDKLAEIRGLAEKNGATDAVEAYIQEEGGEPNLEQYNPNPQAAPDAPANKVGDVVKLTKPGANGPVNIAGTITKIMPDGRLEIRTQQDGYLMRKPSELGHRAGPAPQAAADGKTLGEMLTEAGTQGVWLGRLIQPDGQPAVEAKAVRWPARNLGPFGFELWYEGKKQWSAPFPRVSSKETARELADTLLDYFNEDGGSKYAMDQIGEKHARLMEQRSTLDQRKDDAELASMRKERGDADERPWDQADRETKREIDRISALRFKTAAQERMLELLTMRLAGRPDKWNIGDGVSYKVTAGGAGMQTNRGFRIVAKDDASKTVTLRSVADTGLTSSGGNNDRIGDIDIHVGELKRDRKYDAPQPAAEAEAPAEPALTPQAAADAPAEPDYLAELFGTPAQQAEAQARALAAQKAAAQDKARIRDAISAEKKRAVAEHDDWAGRVYKANKSQVDLPGDGPSSRESMSIGAINEGRRRKAMESLTQEMRALDKLADSVSTDSGAERVLQNMRDLMTKAERAVESGNWPGQTVGSMFEEMLLAELQMRGPGGKGNVTSNGLSKAMLAAVKPESKAAADKAEAPGWHTPLPEQGEPSTQQDRTNATNPKAPVDARKVSARLAAQAFEAITQAQRTNLAVSGMKLYPWVLPAQGRRNGVVRLLPEDQQPGNPWQQIGTEPVNAGGVRNLAINDLTAKLGREPIIGDENAAADKPAAEGPAPTETATNPLDAESNLWQRISVGKATPEEFKAGFQAWLDNKPAIKEAMSKLKKDELLKMGGSMFAYRYKSETKPEIVEALWRDGLSTYTLGRGYSYGMGEGSQERAVRALVEATDADQLAQYAAEQKAAEDEAVARVAKVADAIKDPKTFDDYKTWMRATMQGGKTFKEARMMLTPEQRATFDDLAATETRGQRKNTTDIPKTQVRVAGQTVDGEIIATKHTRDGHDLYVVRLAERVSTEDYQTLLAGAKRIGGSYSSYRGNGAVPGFQFRTREAAEAFQKLAQGDNAAAIEAAKERRDAYQDDRSQSAAERLTEMADKMEADADESLSLERKANTARRARFAASAEAGARNLKAMAKTMRNVAGALTSGSAKFLDRIRTRTQVELLQTYVKNAHYDELRAKYSTYVEQQKREGQPPTPETADYAQFPEFTAYRSDLASLGRQLQEVDGTKKLGDQIMKVADDVSDAFIAWAKEPGNLFRLSTFSVRSGEDVKTAIFKDRETAERAIKRSGLSGKAIVFPEKRGVNRIVMSPSEAIAKGIWQGDGDKRITLTGEFGAELVEKIGRAARRDNRLSVPWQFERAHERRKQLQRMGIETPAEFRAALREFIGLLEQAAEADRIKMLERAMVGKAKDGLDFFPTPESVADEMVAAADIQPDMAVLEPSAGMGHIADRIRAAGAEPDVVEMANDRRELLQEKGYTLQGSDFLALKPREFFTYGDVFRAPDGTEGVMMGSGGMGSSRVMLRPLQEDGTPDMRRGTYHTRDDLVGVRHRGYASGYDRILMNPPFSDGRDIQHVRHAYGLLKPGGRLVALMGESAFTNQNKRATEFREWLESVGGTEEKLPEGTFNDPSLPVNTGANARMVVVERGTDDAGSGAMYSRTRAAPDEAAALQALSENDDLFALPKSEATTLREIGLDIAPQIVVSKAPTMAGTSETWNITMPTGEVGKLYVRKPNPFGPTVYGFDLNEGEITSTYEGRPGTNPDDVDPDTEDVYIDVSKLQPGQGGNQVYAIAAAYAHNTGRIFIGDPAGLSDDAMRRRSENMLSSALRYGTTRHLAIHPRQEAGAKSIGVPPLQWTYGDDLGNIRRLIDVNVKALENAFPAAKKIDFDADTGQFRNADTGAALERSAIERAARERRRGLDERLAGTGVARVAGVQSALRGASAGGSTIARGAVWRALSREEGAGSQGSGRRNGLLVRLAQLGAQSVPGLNRLFSRPAAGTTTPAQLRTALETEFTPETIGALERAGLLNIVYRPQSNMPRDAAGVFDGKRIELFSTNTAPGSTAVAYHEALHATLKASIGADTYAALMDRLAKIDAQAQADGAVSRFFKQAAGRIPDDVTGAVRTEELAAYAVEQYQSARERMPIVVRKWVQDLLAALRLGLAKALQGVGVGVKVRARLLADPATLHKLARDGLQAMARQGMQGDAAMAFSQQAAGPKWFSALKRAVDGLSMGAAPAQGWKDSIKGLVAKGSVKADEVEWTGLNEFLDLQQGKIKKSDVQDFLAANGVQVTETVLGERRAAGWRDISRALADTGLNQDKAARIAQAAANGDEDAIAEAMDYGVDVSEVFGDDGAGATKYGQYTLPGGTNYREVLLTLPSRPGRYEARQAEGKWRIWNNDANDWARFPGSSKLLTGYDSQEAARQALSVMGGGEANNYRSSHWDQPNVLAHIRLNDRTDADGKRVLFVEEIQSDWGQAGKKKGFADPAKKEAARAARAAYKAAVQGNAPEQEELRLHAEMTRANRAASENDLAVPAAPFITATDKWLGLALKRVIKMAVDGGYDKVAFVNGEQSADRYKLSKEVSEVSWRVRRGEKNATVSLKNGDDLTFYLDANGAVQSVEGTGETTFIGKSFDDIVGKDIAAKVMADERGVLAGNGLDIGGTGMKAFYDKIIPSALKDVLRKFGGGAMETVQIDTAPKFDATPADLMVRINKTSDGQFRVGVGAGDERVAKTLPTLAEAEAWAAEQQAAARARLLKAQPGFTITESMRDKASQGMPLFSRAAQNASPGTGWAMPEASRFDDFVYRFQDKNVDLKRAIADITKGRQALEDRVDAYLQEELFHERAAKRTQDFTKDELGPIMKDMAARGITLETLDEYLHNRHAEEANKVAAERNKDDRGNSTMPDGGSGIKTADARAYLAKLDQGKRKRLEAVAAKVDAIIAKTRQTLVDYGLESQTVTDGWASQFEHYVPLMREDEGGGMGTGQGFSIKGKESKSRTGSTDRKVVDILANIAMQRERAIVRGEKNRVAVAMVGLVDANPAPDFWQADSVPTERVFNDRTGLVETRQIPNFKNRPNVLVAKIMGPNGEVQERAVVFNERNKRAMRMAESLKNLDAAHLEGLLGVSAKITRYFAAINTQYNPVFGFVNFIRDVQGAIINLQSTALKGSEKAVMKDVMPALAGVYADARKVRKGGVATSKWANLWEEFQDEGGATGFRDLFRTSEDRANAIKREIDPTAWMNSSMGKVFTANGNLKVPLAQAQKGATWIFDWLSDYNLAMENAVRLSAYKVALDQGMTKQRAASLAKNLTVNFNRKGQAGMQAGAVYAFFNAAMQGTARMGDVLFEGEGSSQRLSSLGRKIIYGGMALGAMQAMALAAAGFDDDEPPPFVRERSLVIPIGALVGGKEYISIPMPLGWHVIPGLGREATEFALSGFKDPGKRLASLVGLFADAFNPIGNAGMSLQTITPTALDPLVALSENRDWTGKPIARESFDRTTPGFALAKDTASAPAKWISEMINAASGGTQYTAGILSPTPDQIDYLWGQVTGGVGRELSKVEQTAKSAFTGESLPTYKIPLVGRFVGDAEGPTSQGNRFYENLNQINLHEAQLKGLRKDGKIEEAAQYRADNPQASLVSVANMAERQVRRLRARKRELLANDAPREDIRQIEEQITNAMTRLNEAVKRREVAGV